MPAQREANAKMDQVEKLFELYKQTQAPSERSVLLETVRISNPDGFARLEERIVKEQVRAMTLEGLVQLIADHRDLPLEQAEELLRDTIFQALLDRSKLNPLAPALKTSPEGAPGAGKSPIMPTQAPPQQTELRGGVRVVILNGPKQDEETPTVGGKISQPKQNDIVGQREEHTCVHPACCGICSGR